MTLHPDRSRWRRGVLTVSLALVAGLLLAACGSAATAGPPPPRSATGEVDPEAIIQAGISYPLSGGFDPMTTTGAVTVAANWHVFEGLTELDPVSREARPALGSTLPRKVNDTTYEVDLRKGAVFQNGDPVTTQDILYSFQRVQGPENDSIYASFIDFVDQVTAVDGDTIRITTTHPFNLVAERLSVVKIVPKALVESDENSFNSLPVGTGPYKITQATPDDKIVFERFDQYNGPHPARAKGMVWNLLSDSAARVTALNSGTVSAIEDVPYIDLPGIDGDTATADSAQSFNLLFMMFNTKKKPFDDVRVRQALFYALDMDRLIGTGLLGHGTAATGFLPENHPNYDRASTVYDHDPEKARTLLAEAGVTDLSLTLTTTDTGWVSDIVPLIQQDFEAVGVRTTLDIGQSAGQYTKVDGGNLDVMVAPGDPSVFGNDPDLLMRWWYGTNVWSESRYRWADNPRFAQLQSLLDKAVRTQGPEQQQLWNQAMDLVSDEVPLYPILHRRLPTAWDGTRLAGFEPLTVTGLNFLDVGQVR